MKYMKRPCVELENIIREERENLTSVPTHAKDDERIAELKWENGSITVRIQMKNKHPTMVLTNEARDGETSNSIYLFISEAVKILKYLNTRFDITNSQSLKFKENNFSSDQFF